MNKKIKKEKENLNSVVKNSFFARMRDNIVHWASDNFFVPTFVTGSGTSEEVLSHLFFESSHNDVFLADRDSTSLKPDLLIISGIINHKNLENIKIEFSKLVGRKYVVVIGQSEPDARQLNSYNIIKNIQDHVPVDLFIYGNPPSRHEIISGLNSLKDIRR